MEHKAFVFDYLTFDRELRAILEDALATGDSSEVVSFINANLSNLRDPYEGEPLGNDWESFIDTHDAHQYGDFALTKYYDPLADKGLGTSWESAQEMIAVNTTLKESPILGSTIGPKDEPFDPGKMGSYFQSPRQVRESYEYMLEIAAKIPSGDLTKAVQMLEEARKSENGLYITF